MIPAPIPHGATARRLEWRYLPPAVRASVEARFGSPVVHEDVQGAGFTPGLASVLTCADGSLHFLKAASVVAQRNVAASYREEAARLGRLPADTPAPALLWAHEDDEWVLLETAHVPARAPQRPWTRADVDATVALLDEVARLLTPPPGDLVLDTFAAEMADLPACWVGVRRVAPDLDGFAEHVDQAAALAAGFAAVTAGETVVHTDVRDDNLLRLPDGRMLLCDWNWPVRGAPWIDTVLAMIGPRADGHAVDAVLAHAPLTRGVPAEDVDALIALMAGSFLSSGLLPVPTTSPHVRDFQWWQGVVCWDWLAERRGWSA